MVESRSIFFKILNPLFVFLGYLFLYVPMLVMVLFSFNSSHSGASWTGFSFKWYVKLLHTPEMLNSLYVSLIVALCSTLLSIFIGTFLVFASRWWKSFFLFGIFYSNLILPDIVLAICILSVFAFLNIPLGYGSLIAGHTLIGLGFVIPIVRARFIELDPVLTEASLDLGATYLQTFRKVILPLLMPSLIASSLLVFTISLDDFLIAFFCSSPSVQTLSVYIFSMVRAGVDPSINAISTILLVVSSLFVLLLSGFKVIDQVISYE
ncbi:MAG: ABC transporter permease [bacterium]